jgi:cysteine desulfurase / selenocysteine lyase
VIDLESSIREEFPYLADHVYLNTGAAGLSPIRLGQAAARFYTDAMSRGYNGIPVWQSRADALRTALAQLLGASERNILYVSNTTEALNLAAHSIVWRRDDRIVFATDEFPSVALPWLHATEHGARLVRVPIEREGDRETRLLEAIGSRARVVAVSHVHSSTGSVVDLGRISAAARAAGALLVVDGIQAVGAIPVVLGDDVDVYCFAGFKWLCAGFGLGVMLVSDRALDAMEPTYRGYENPPPERGLRYSHWNYPGIYALAGALEWLAQISWPAIYDRTRSLVNRAADGLTRLGYELAGSTPRAGIVSFSARDPDALVDELARRDIDVAVRGGRVRVSPHFYNTAADVDRFLSAVGELASPSRSGRDCETGVSTG